MSNVRKMDAFRLLEARLRWILYSTYLWNPVRDKLLDDHNKGKFVLINGTTKQQQQQKQEVSIRLAVGDGPEVGINQWPLPRIDRWAKFYQRLSTIIMVWSFILISILIYTGNISSPDKTLGYQFSLLCHVPRLAIHEIFEYTVIHYAAYAASILHLFWRFVISSVEGSIILNSIIFLLIDEATFEKLRQGSQDAVATYRQHETLELTQRIMFYKVEDNLHNLVEFYVRPNRSREARVKLTKIVNLGSSIIGFILVSVSTIFILACAWTFLMTPQVAYTGCKIELFDLAHIYRFIGSMIVCTVFILDTIATLMYPIFVAYIAVEDLMVYWRRIQSMLADHLKMIRQLRAQNDFLITPDAICSQPKDLSRRHYHNSIRYLSYNTNISNFPSKERRAEATFDEHKCFDKPEVPDLEARSQEIQSIVADFFAQLEEADQYVSLVLAWAFCIWLAVVAVVFMMGLRTGTNLPTTLLIRVVQFYGFLILLLVTALTLSLKRATEPAYITLCSIMAHDPSIEKRRWASLLKYFTGKHQKHAFTIAHSRLYTFGIFLENFSYTFTFGLYLQTFGFIDMKRS